MEHGTMRPLGLTTMMFGTEHLSKLVLIFFLLKNSAAVFAFSSVHYLPPANVEVYCLGGRGCLTHRDTALVASPRSIHVHFDMRRRKHVPFPIISLKASRGSADDDSTWISTVSGNSNTNDALTQSEVNLDWKVWYENAVVQIHTMQQQVNTQVQALLKQIEELQQHLGSMAVELQNKNLHLEQAQNETMTWQTLYKSMRQQHLSEIEALQNQYDTYVQNQLHQQVRNQIQYQRMQQQLKEQNSVYQSGLQQLQLQHENEKLLLWNDHKLLVQQLQANATLREQALRDQSQRELSLKLRQQEELLERTIVEPLRRELQQSRNELKTANNAVLQNQERIAELEQNQQSARFLLSKLSSVWKRRMAALAPRRWSLPKLRPRAPPPDLAEVNKLLVEKLKATNTKVDVPS